MRRTRITITAEAVCDDDRWLSRDVARAARSVAEMDNVRDGCAPHVFVHEFTAIHETKCLLSGKEAITETLVHTTYTARFKWWHFLLPAWVLRRLPDPAVRWLP